MQLFFEQMVNGLTAGAQYALLAAGLSLIFGVVGVVNFAHGEFYMLGSYAVYVAESRLSLGYASAGAVAVVAMAVFGMAFYFVVIRPTLARGWQIQLVATLAASILIVNAMIAGEGSLPRTVTSPALMHIVTLGGVRTSLQRILVFVTALLVFAALAGFLKWTRAGKAMRAVAQNREASSVVGVSLERIGMLAVVAAAVLAGVSAVLVAPLSDVEPTMGTATLLKAFAAVIVGGFGSVTGAISSSFVIGLTEAFSIAYISSAYADGIVFAVMITILLLRPHGLFGRAVRA